MKELIINALQTAGKPTEGKVRCRTDGRLQPASGREGGSQKDGGDEIDPPPASLRKRAGQQQRRSAGMV